VLLIVDLIWVVSAELTEVNLVAFTVVILNQYFSLNSFLLKGCDVKCCLCGG